MPQKDDKAEKPAERRPKARKRVLLTGIVTFAGGERSFGCTIRDLSETGARIALPKGAPLPLDFYLINVRDRLAYEARLVRNNGSEAGLVFQKTLPLARLDDPALGFLKRLWLSKATS